ncbi:uncharacterized protein An06g00790 [Aspergillus niger]|uniref:Contig An06c0040, genomic contig n=2 Tax=Aspergillus niger TaxID=5061 RepID=A2QLD4_ASPNC|nr:uncharacterized protein An06g00790 [Aspergillus niger]CAK44986.1 unnamed protein product [Aspergillus niger]
MWLSQFGVRVVPLSECAGTMYILGIVHPELPSLDKALVLSAVQGCPQLASSPLSVRLLYLLSS